jgi:hypothetical protein
LAKWALTVHLSQKFCDITFVGEGV